MVKQYVGVPRVPGAFGVRKTRPKKERDATVASMVCVRRRRAMRSHHEL